MTCGIYKITNTINGKFYIGSSKNIEHRWYIHKSQLKNGKHINIYLQRAYNKYGLNVFICDIICICDGYSSDRLLNLEQYFLDKINTKSYNLSKNAKGGDNISYHPNKEDISKKISKSLKEKYKSKEYLDNVKERRVGNNNPMYGKNHTENSKKKISEKLKDYYKSNKNYKSGKKFEDVFDKDKVKQLKENLSNKASKRIGNKNSFYGKKHTKKTKKIISEKRKNKININQCVAVIIDDKEYYSLAEASRILKIPISTILWRIKSKNIKFINYNYI